MKRKNVTFDDNNKKLNDKKKIIENPIDLTDILSNLKQKANYFL